MLSSRSALPTLPPLFSLALRTLPLLPLQPLLALLLQRILQRHPGIFERLGPYAEKRYGIDAIDLPFAFVLEPRPVRPTLVAGSNKGRVPSLLVARRHCLWSQFQGLQPAWTCAAGLAARAMASAPRLGARAGKYAAVFRIAREIARYSGASRAYRPGSPGSQP